MFHCTCVEVINEGNTFQAVEHIILFMVQGYHWVLNTGSMLSEHAAARGPGYPVASELAWLGMRPLSFYYQLLI